jgi:hypothetical protein
MSWIQKLFTSILPRSWAAALERESRAWKVICPCGEVRSVWETGGIRYKAAGNPKRLLNCNRCGQRTWHQVEYRKEASQPN